MILFDQQGWRFNYRVAGVTIQEGQVLLCREPNLGFWYLPGGRVEAGEPAAPALQREIQEELGLEGIVGRLLWVVENFFELEGRSFHELGLYFTLDLPLHPISGVFRGKETSVEVHFRWFNLEELESIELKPGFLKTALSKLPQTAQHLVLHDPARSR